LPGLIAELSTRAGRVSRVGLQADAFRNIPHKLTVSGRKVPVGWFRYMNKHTVILTMAGRDDLVLLVIPPRASPEAAAEALGLAASGSRAGPPEAILAAAGIAVGSCGLGRHDERPRCRRPATSTAPQHRSGQRSRPRSAAADDPARGPRRARRGRFSRPEPAGGCHHTRRIAAGPDRRQQLTPALIGVG